MTIAIDIILSLILIFIGYISVCYYLNNIAWISINLTVLRPSKNKIIYLSLEILTVAFIIVLFQAVYKLDVISQIKLLVLVLIIFPIAAIDLKLQKIPNCFILSALVIRGLIYIAEFIISVPAAFSTLKDGFLGAIILGGFFLLLLLIFKNSIGMGDIKLFVVMGLYQGLWGAINSVFFSLIVSFFISISLLIGKKKGRKDTIPFGPSVLLGIIIAIALSGM